jgi:hypothetical protein
MGASLLVVHVTFSSREDQLQLNVFICFRLLRLPSRSPIYSSACDSYDVCK